MPELNLDSVCGRGKFPDIPLSKLDEKHAEVILFILRSGPMKKTELTQNVTNSSDTVKKRVDLLAGLGLVREVQENQRPFRKMVELTDLGSAVAENLARINELLYNALYRRSE